MKQRIITGVVGIAVTLLVLTQYYKPIYDRVVLLLFLVSLYEIWKTFSEKNNIIIFIVMGMAGAYFMLDEWIPRVHPLIMATLVFFTYSMVTVFFFEKIDFKTISASMLFSMYSMFGFYSLTAMKDFLPRERFGYDGLFVLVMCCVIAWGADVSAYFSGYFFGKHKMAPVLSPKKTVEGAVGGVVLTTIASVIVMAVYAKYKHVLEGAGRRFELKSEMLVAVAIAAVAAVLLEMVGDLFRSAVKRQAGIKDYGDIFPGHGGVLDRFDSMIMISPFFLLLSMLIAKAGGMFVV